jgi:hypothetical protein
MKKLVIVLLALLVAGSAMAAEKITDTSAVPQIAGSLDSDMREVLVEFTEFTAAGYAFFLYDADPLMGSFSGAVGDFTMLYDGLNYTWCDDLCLLIANADLSEVLVQVGGFSNTGALNRFSWPDGSSSAGGTVGGGSVDFGGDIDVTGYYLYLGNGYSSGGDGVWTGSIQMLGSVVDNEASSMDSVKALYR